MKILFVVHHPWVRELGAAKVCIELAEEFRKRGHIVEKFDFFDAFPELKGISDTRWGRLRRRFLPSFSERAAAFVRKNGHRFDVIDAMHGYLPQAKQELGYDGLMVARSVGLYLHYRAVAEELAVKEEPGRTSVSFSGIVRKLLPEVRDTKQGDFESSLKNADLINLLNSDELKTLENELGFGDKCIVLPAGLTRDRMDTLKLNRISAEERLQERRVVFIGAWGPRKGSRDWGGIIRLVRKGISCANFRFLGTGLAPDEVFFDLDLDSKKGVEIVPFFESEDLPVFLRDATVGAFPSYIEGFGLGVLEQLAAGVPTVAYDVPGPREMLRRLNVGLLSPKGNRKLMAGGVIRILEMPNQQYEDLCVGSVEVAGHFCWEEIAEETIEIYEEKKRKLECR